MQPGQQVPHTVCVIFNAEVSQQTAESLLATMTTCATQGVKKVYLAISTSGGDVTQGLTLYTALRGMPFELTTHNIGNIDSIGNAVFLAGKKRFAAPHSRFMFHGVSWNLPQPISLDEKQVREILGNIEREHGRIGTIIEERTKIRSADIPELFLQAQTKNATDAVSCGIIDDVREFQVPNGAPVITLTFQR